MALSTVIVVSTTALLGCLFLRAVARADRSLLPRAALVLGLAVGVDAALGLTGALLVFDRFPPPFALFFIFNLAIASYVGFSRIGTALVRSLSWSQLVGYQSFRILAELLLFAGFKEGRTPIQLTFEGYNYDIVTGAGALLLGLYLRKNHNRALIHAWNAYGIAALFVIAFIAMTSLPLPFRVFMNEPTNEWVATFPYIWLPGVLVPAAIAGHILVIRKFRLSSKA